jgi:hypothetical protein
MVRVTIFAWDHRARTRVYVDADDAAAIASRLIREGFNMHIMKMDERQAIAESETSRSDAEKERAARVIFYVFGTT